MGALHIKDLASRPSNSYSQVPVTCFKAFYPSSQVPFLPGTYSLKTLELHTLLLPTLNLPYPYPTHRCLSAHSLADWNTFFTHRVTSFDFPQYPFHLDAIFKKTDDLGLSDGLEGKNS